MDDVINRLENKTNKNLNKKRPKRTRSATSKNKAQDSNLNNDIKLNLEKLKNINNTVKFQDEPEYIKKPEYDHHTHDKNIETLRKKLKFLKMSMDTYEY